LTTTLSKGFYYACVDIKATRRFVIYPGDDSFPLSDGVEVMSLSIFLQLM